MSAGNSYFSESAIKNILSHTVKNYSKSIITSPDKPAEHNFRALGYPENKVRRKAKLNANLLKNRAQRVIEELGNNVAESIILFDWNNKLEENEFYKEAHNEVLALYSKNEAFTKDVRETTLDVLINKLGSGKISDPENAIDEALQYLLKELAFVIASPRLFEAKRVTYIYHKNWEVYEKLIKGFYDGVVRESLGFQLFR